MKKAKLEAEETAMSAKSTLTNAIMAVKSCSKAILAACRGYGKSPCFLQVAFLQLVGPDYRLLVLPSVDGEEFLD